MRQFFANQHDEQEENHWLSISDLMAGLMMVFLFIAIALMRHAYIERDRIKQVAVAYQENQVAIYDALFLEFEQDLERWNARIDKETLTFIFDSPDVLFKRGQSDLTLEYQQLLSDFFPRYVSTLLPFRDSLSEVRIEGHTSSAWAKNSTDTEAYFKNMELSQGRTRSVLQYIYQLPAVRDHQPWVKGVMAAVGLSSSKLVYDEQGNEDPEHSRRVLIRAITNADVQIKSILEGSQ